MHEFLRKLARLGRALMPKRVAIKKGDRFVMYGHKDDPFRGHFSVTVTQTSEDGNWIEYQYAYGTRSSLRRDLFVTTYEKL